MSYKIEFLHDGRTTLTKDWKGTFAQARALADDLIAADSRLKIKIRNAEGELLLYRPEDK